MCKRGDVYWAELPKMENSKIQAGTRPVIITANKFATKYSPVFQFIPVTREFKKTNLPVHVLLSSDCFPEESMALVEQEGCIDKHRLRAKIGTISEEDMFEIDKAILIQRGIDVYSLIKRMDMKHVG